MDDSRYMEPLLCCFPNRPEPLIAQIITCYMTFGTPQEDSKRTLACALRMLLSFHCPLKEMSLLLLSAVSYTHLKISGFLLKAFVAQHPEMKEPCCITLCQLFLKKDESLQKKAANFISKHGDASSSNLQETLQSYQPEMFQSVHAILSSFKPQPAEDTLSLIHIFPIP